MYTASAIYPSVKYMQVVRAGAQMTPLCIIILLSTVINGKFGK